MTNVFPSILSPQQPSKSGPVLQILIINPVCEFIIMVVIHQI